MNERDIVKGITEDTKCLYDVYTKSFIDQNILSLLNISYGTTLPTEITDGMIFFLYSE